MTPDSPLDVSVVIVNWNTREMLRDCLASVYAETRDISYEVIVIDNGSTDGSVEMVMEKFPDAILIVNPDNRGFAAANNQGFAVARGRYWLMLNSDTIVLAGAIERTLAFAERHPDTAATGCRVLNPDRTLQNTCFMFPSLLNWFLFATYLYKLFPGSRFFGREQMSWWLRDDEREVDVVTGCYMLVNRKAAEEVGVLDGEFFMYAEETDWCYRFKLGGWKNRFTPDAQIIHIGGGSAPKYSGNRARIANVSFLYYMQKHWTKSNALLGAGLIALFYLTRLVALVPRHVLAAGGGDRKQFENHWLGLKDIVGRMFRGN